MVATVVDMTIDCIYIFDVVLMFFTSVLGRRGKERFDSKLIAHRLTHSFRFYIELLSVLGTDIISSNINWLKPFSLLKVLRIFRLNKLIAQTNIDKVTKSLMNLMKLTFYLIFYLHTISCGYYMVVSYNAPTQYYHQHTDGHYIS